MILQRACALIIGTGTMIAGIMRFIPFANLPGWETAEPIHGFLHISTAAIWLASVWIQQGSYAAWVNRWLGAFWLVVGILGNWGLLEVVEALAFDDNVVHLIIGAVSTAIGWGSTTAILLRRRI